MTSPTTPPSGDGTTEDPGTDPAVDPATASVEPVYEPIQELQPAEAGVEVASVTEGSTPIKKSSKALKSVLASVGVGALSLLGM